MKLYSDSSVLVAAFSPEAFTNRALDIPCTWNFKHLANVLALRRLRQVNEKRGLFVPQVCTPEELPGE